MEKLGLNQIRDMFLNFYENKQHYRRGSFSLIPNSDKSLLIINSGMAPLKPYFAGIEKPPAPRMATCQKCIRTADIENVGKTSRHGTFFEMLGSFSFGDYFKKESITWGWEFLTDVLKMPEDRLWVTVYHEDDEAYELWKNHIGFPEEKIVKLGKEDNFWEIGTGPCGPCSEIYFDRGEKYGCDNPNCKPGCDCDRYIEFWNHVFTQFNRKDDGTYEPLAKPNIDTGMGLERIACIMQEVDSIFDVDTIRMVLNEVCSLGGKTYLGGEEEDDISIRIITDHVRSATFMISDGIMPSNEGRGYVLRRLIRRAVRHGRKIGIEGSFLNKLVDKVITSSESAYPELLTQELFIKKIIAQEEERFSKTLSQGLDIMEKHMKELKKNGESKISGDFAFKLHDTYGFPFEITDEIAGENGFAISRDEFDTYMNIQKSLGKSDADKKDFAWKEEEENHLKTVRTLFVGYDENQCLGKVLKIIVENELVNTLDEGKEGIIVTDRSVFYPNGGGQNSDRGYIESKNGLCKVVDVQKRGEAILHKVVVERGQVISDENVTLRVDICSRNNSKRNHTSTHMLHKALKNRLGSHVKQSGSLVDENILRFDFSHFEPLSKEDIAIIEKEINTNIDLFLDVSSEEMTMDEAKKMGAIGLFEDKYGETVRVVSINGYSSELCGGMHVSNTGEIGGFKILSESGISAGIRRIEAITGKALREYAREKQESLDTITALFKTTPDMVIKKSESIINELKEVKREMDAINAENMKKQASAFADDGIDIKGILLIRKAFENYEINDLKSICDDLRSKHENIFIVFINSNKGKHTLITAISKKLIDERGYNAGKIIKGLAAIAGGGGGGKPDIAQAGINDINKIDDIFKAVEDII